MKPPLFITQINPSSYWDGSMSWCLVGAEKHLEGNCIDSEKWPVAPGNALCGNDLFIDCRIPESVREQIAKCQIPNLSYSEYLAATTTTPAPPASD